MTTLHSTIAVCALASLLGAAPLGAQTLGPEGAAVRTVARQIPIGATVKLRTTDGQRFKAVLFGVDGEGITVKPATRIPVASLRIAYGRLDSVERDEGRIE